MKIRSSRPTYLSQHAHYILKSYDYGSETSRAIISRGNLSNNFSGVSSICMTYASFSYLPRPGFLKPYIRSLTNHSEEKTTAAGNSLAVRRSSDLRSNNPVWLLSQLSSLSVGFAISQFVLSCLLHAFFWPC